MNKFLRVGLHTLYACGLLLLLIFSGGQYDWMADIEPSIPTNSIEDISNNHSVFLGIVLVVAVAAQLIVIISAKKQSERLISVVLIVAVLFAVV